MNRKFIVPIIAVVSAGFMVSACGGGEVVVKPPPVPEVKIEVPPPPPPPVVVVAPPPPPPAPPPPPPPPVATGKIKLRGNRVVIPGELEFDTGKATLKKNAKTKLLVAELVAFFQANPQVTRLQVEGHTDNVGNADFNQKLSQERADSVQAELAAAGVDTGRMVSKGFGSTVDYREHGKDIPNDTDKHKAMNRRVEFHVLQLGGADWAAPPEDPMAK